MRGVYANGSAIRLHHDLPEPAILPGEVELAVRKAGICETDLQLARGYMGFRGILGHEFVGQTRTGRRVTAEINNSCHHCPTCWAGHPHHCPNRSVLGILNHNGAMADRVTVPERNLHFLPDTIDDDEAVFIEPLAAAFRITEQVNFTPATKVAVLGDGKLGLLSTWVLRLTGAAVTLIGKHPEKLRLAGEQVRTCPLDDVATLARSFDVVVDCTGSTSGLTTAFGIVHPCGTIVLKTTVAGTHDVSLAPIVIDEVRIVGSRCGPFLPAITALASRQVDVHPLIAAEYPLDQAEAAFEAAARPGARKILISVNDRQ